MGKLNPRSFSSFFFARSVSIFAVLTLWVPTVSVILLWLRPAGVCAAAGMQVWEAPVAWIRSLTAHALDMAVCSRANSIAQVHLVEQCEFNCSNSACASHARSLAVSRAIAALRVSCGAFAFPCKVVGMVSFA